MRLNRGVTSLLSMEICNAFSVKLSHMITITFVGEPEEKLTTCSEGDPVLYKLSVTSLTRCVVRYWYGFFSNAPLLTRLCRKFQEALMAAWFA